MTELQKTGYSSVECTQLTVCSMNRDLGSGQLSRLLACRLSLVGLYLQVVVHALSTRCTVTARSDLLSVVYKVKYSIECGTSMCHCSGTSSLCAQSTITHVSEGSHAYSTAPTHVSTRHACMSRCYKPVHQTTSHAIGNHFPCCQRYLPRDTASACLSGHRPFGSCCQTRYWHAAIESYVSRQGLVQ